MRHKYSTKDFDIVLGKKEKDLRNAISMIVNCWFLVKERERRVVSQIILARIEAESHSKTVRVQRSVVTVRKSQNDDARSTLTVERKASTKAYQGNL